MLTASDWLITLRRIRREPLYMLTIFISIGLGICAATTTFSLFQSIFLEPLPGVAHSRSLQLLMESWQDYSTTAFSYPRFRDLQSGLGSSMSLAGYSMDRVTVRNGTDSEELWTVLVSDNFFSTLQIAPFRGSWFAGTDPFQAVISYGFWQRELHSDDAAIGKSIVCNGHPVTIVGIARPEFLGPYSALSLDLYLPLTANDVLQPNRKRLEDPGRRWVSLMSRLAPGVSAAQASAATQLVEQRLNARDGIKGNVLIEVLPFWQSPMGAQVIMGPVTIALAGLAIAVLLVALSNSVSLLLLRNDKRQQEFSLEVALGASKWHLCRHLIPECIAASVPGALLGLVLSYLALNNLQRLIPNLHFPLYIHFSFTVQALCFSLGLGVVIAALLVFLTITGAFSADLNTSLRQAGAQTSLSRMQKRLKYGFLALQITFSVFLLGAAGMLWHSVSKAREIDLGYQPGNIYAVEVDLAHSGLNATQRLDANRNLIHLLQPPGTSVSAALAASVPFSFGSQNKVQFQADSANLNNPSQSTIAFNAISPGYFALLKTPLVVGRDFTAADDDHRPRVAIINRATALRYWKNAGAVGRTIRVGEDSYEIVGICENQHLNSLGDTPEPFLYLPLLQYTRPSFYVESTGLGAPDDAYRAMKEQVRQVIPEAAIISELGLGSQLDTILFPQRIAAVMCFVFACLGIFLTGGGIHAAIQQVVRSRNQEIGLRLAFGASKSDIRSILLHEIGVLLFFSSLVGVAADILAGKVAAGLLSGIRGVDLASLSAAIAIIVVTALLASWRPMSRALQINPVDLLRNE